MSYGADTKSGQKASTTITYVQEKRLAEFLEQGMKLKKDFLQKLEEEKRAEELEEEEKSSQIDEDELSGGAARLHEDDGLDEENTQMNNFSLDQIAYMLTQSIIFCQMPKWESTYKQQFFSIILCTVANIKDDKSSD